MRILVVENNKDQADSLREDLSRVGFAVDLARDGIDGEFLGSQEPYDAVVLDLGLPERSGLEVLRNWRVQGNSVPVIVLTARAEWMEKVEGFKAGADDYLAKPFHFEELVERIRALIRRRHGQAASALQSHGLTLDEECQRACLDDGQVVQLTGTEFRLLRYFMLNPGRVLSKTRLSEHVYEYDDDKDSNVIEVYVNRLRQKIGKDRITTRRGQGYVFGEAMK